MQILLFKMNRLNLSILDKIRTFHLGSRSAWEKVNPVQKRGSVLYKMIANKDKKKNWHFHILNNNPKSRNVFEHVTNPKRRQNVLNSLFIRNISDVISTGDVVPEIMGYGIEISGVKVSPCCKMVHVYWQIPQNNDSDDENISTLLNLKAPNIRAELISRNVMGRIPQILFVRDTTNAYKAAFEKAIEKIDLGPENQAAVVPDDFFTTKKKKIYSFKMPKETKILEATEHNEPSKGLKEQTNDFPPPRPRDMKYDVFGLNHEDFMNKVLSSRMKLKTSTHVIHNPESDLFSNIPGTTLQGNSDRETLLKQFQIQRKIMMKKKYNDKVQDGDHLYSSQSFNSNDLSESSFDENFPEYDKEDFIDEDTTERY